MGGRKRRETSMNSRRIVFARRVRCALCRLVSVVLILHLAEARAGSELLEHAGLRAPVEIILDPWGVAHIYAQSEADLFFAQGYHVARTRLFQLEIWRRQATGTVAEILGRRELPRDIGARLLRYRGDMDRELNHYHPRGRQIIESFVNGINAFVEQAQDNPELLPSEFRLLGIRPGRWTPEVVVSRHQGLMHNVAQELEYGRAVALLGAAQVKELVWFHPGEARVELDSALNSALNAGVLEADILQLYRAARSSIAFQPEDVLPEFRAAASPPPLRAEAALLVDRSSPPFDWRDIGSNNWVVSGRLTADGSTIMANDPHRVLQAPSLRYFTHLVAPGWNVIGGGEPSLPGVSIGHNEFGAWGLTVFQVDAEDLYVYQTHPRDPLQYRYGDGWEPMQVLRESIPVKGEAAVEVDLKFTRHGPVLYEDAKRQVACALRAGWLEPGGAPYLASLRMDVARNWDEFCDACAYSHIPGENMVWADREGNIGWQAVGIAPLRSNWDGLVPVPGDGRYEWQGYLPGKQLPQVVNPPKGFWNTSNENLVPENYPHRRALGWTWVDPFRGARVHEVLAAGRKFNMMDMMQLQDAGTVAARSAAAERRSRRSNAAAARLGLCSGPRFGAGRDLRHVGTSPEGEPARPAGAPSRSAPHQVIVDEADSGLAAGARRTLGGRSAGRPGCPAADVARGSADRTAAPLRRGHAVLAVRSGGLQARLLAASAESRGQPGVARPAECWSVTAGRQQLYGKQYRR
jgi:penicillin G amidase